MTDAFCLRAVFQKLVSLSLSKKLFRLKTDKWPKIHRRKSGLPLFGICIQICFTFAQTHPFSSISSSIPNSFSSFLLFKYCLNQKKTKREVGGDRGRRQEEGGGDLEAGETGKPSYAGSFAAALSRLQTQILLLLLAPGVISGGTAARGQGRGRRGKET